METASGPSSERVVGRPFQPGQSGNPHGRPKRKPITDLVLELLDQPGRGKTGKTRRELIVDRLFSISLSGKRSESIMAIQLLWEYVEGKPSQPVELEIKRAADRLAAATGADPEFLIRRAQQLADENIEGVAQ